MVTEDNTKQRQLKPYINQAGAWALALGTSIGWGSLIVTSNSYLKQAGPWGSIAGLIIGALVMILIGRNYHYMINCYPEAGGAYIYARESFGHDYGFLVSWFLSLTYAAMFWANATSLPLFARFFIGDVFRWGRMYQIFGYDVYLGEALLTLAAIILIALVSTRHKRITIWLMTGLAALLTICITICFIGMLAGHGKSGMVYDPGFIPDKSALSQIIKIACISPWAFIGFENISHSAEEFTFNRNKSLRIMTTAIVSATLLYIFVLMLSVSAYPPEYSSWREYISDLGNLSGIKGLPPFYAANYYMGRTGVFLLILALFGLVITSLIGNTVALSRLMYALSKDSVLPKYFSQLNSNSIPSRTIFLILALSAPIPFVGRTAIGWIVDVTTIGATLIYGFVSASTAKTAEFRGDRLEKITGRVGLVIMLLVAAYLLLPNLFTAGSMEKETYLLFVVWGILGFIFFRSILRRDKSRRFGKSLIVWIALLSLVLLIALIWMSQSMMSSTNTVLTNIHNHYLESGSVGAERLADENFIENQIAQLRTANERTILAATGMFAFAIVILLTNYSYMSKRAKESEAELGMVRNMANTDPLTGVKSKHAYIERENQLDADIASGTAKDLGIVVCDVNGLKYINDTRGHKAGDEYIRSASRLICEIFQHSPVFRIGGDEFVVILSGRDYENRDEVLAELNSRVENNLKTDKVVVSAGMSEFNAASDNNVHSIFERADALMYQRKQELKAKGARTR